MSFRAVTFDCWNTLIYEPDPGPARSRRVGALVRVAAASGERVSRTRAGEAIAAAWDRHIALWEQGVVTGPGEVSAWALEVLGVEGGEAARELAAAFAEASLETDIRPLDGARETLARLADAGVRRALVCDTGLSPGPVVRRLLDRAGLLEWLEVQIFSDEMGVPKPHPRMFEAALAPLDAEPARAVHVGDLRRTDVAGARDFGMRTVRIRHRYDDPSALPEADDVADSHAHLCRILELP